MKLTYWVCPCKDDHQCYGVRARTRREALAEREQLGVERFGKPVKMVVEYRDAFDLATQALGEGGLNEPGASEADDDDTEEK